MAQYPIPQFIESEGKIIFFLTFKQFFWLVGGGGLCILFYYKLPIWLATILSILVALVVALVVFVKIDNVPVATLVLNYVTFSTRSKNYTWSKKQVPYPFTQKNIQDISAGEPEKSKLHQAKGMVEYRKK